MGEGCPEEEEEEEEREEEGALRKRETTCCFRWPNSQASSWPRKWPLRAVLAAH